MDCLLNASVRRDAAYRGLFDPDDYAAVTSFYEAHPELPPTPLISLPGLAAELSVAGLLIKDETGRFGLEAFKIAGARYGVERIGRAALSNGIVCATAGNHGRAVARAARESGVACTVFVPAPRPDAHQVELRTRRARVAAMQADGAQTIDVNGSYEEAVRRAAEHAQATGATIVSDTAWPGYEEIPRLIMLGYTRIFEETAHQWNRRPDVLLVQGGVGGLICAAANWLAWRFGPARPFLIACEPESAACLLESARAGRLVNIEERASGPAEHEGSALTGRRAAHSGMHTFMAGLRCAEPSPAAWPSIHAGVDAFLSIPDALALEAMARLGQPIAGDPAIHAGPSGACGVGALFAVLAAPEAAAVRRACDLNQSTRVMAVATESP